MTYVALLRGINVGGSNIIDMKQLKAAFEDAGMTDVRTYINSGNVIFSSAVKSNEALTGLLERTIRKRFGFDVRVLLRDVASMRSLVKAIPKNWTNDTAMRCDVLFLWKDVDKRSILKQLPIKPEIEDVRYAKGAVIWRVDRENQTKSRMVKLVGTPLYKQMTIRNCNTVRKLVELMDT